LTRAPRRSGPAGYEELAQAVVVGSILALVNYVDRLFTGALVPLDLVKIGLTYVVSTYASVQAIRERREEAGP
jgi:hypothetical protein